MIHIKTQSQTDPRAILPWLWLALSLCLMATSPKVTADPSMQDDSEWFYTYRPSDTMQAVAKRMLNPKYNWSDLVRHNRIDNVKSLQAGSIIKIPMSWLKMQPKPAKVLSVNGNVLHKKARLTTYKMLKANQLIQVGDEVKSRNGTALIKLADNSIIRLESESHIHFNRLSHFGDTGMTDTKIRLKRGGLINTVAPLKRGSRYEISSPSAVAAVRGTEFRMRTEGNRTQIEVTEGKVEFGNRQRSSIINAGEAAEISHQSAQIETRDLFPAPQKQNTNNRLSDLPTQFTWAPVPGAESYKYELTEMSKGQRLQAGEKSSPEVEIANLKSGQYQLAMRAVDSDGFEGLNDLTQLDIALEGQKPTPLQPLDASVANNTNVQFSWKVANPKDLSKVQISSDPDFIDLIIDEPFGKNQTFSASPKLKPGEYFWRVIALNQNHIETTSEQRKIRLQGLMDDVQILSVNYVENQVGLFWNSVDEAQGYVLQISDHPQFRRILREESIEKSSAFLKLQTGKTYYARVKGIGNALYRSEFGPGKKLEIK